MFALSRLASIPQAVRIRGPLFRRVLDGLGIAMHNFPEGLAIGTGYAASDSLVGLAVALALHNIPEGMAMAGPAAEMSPLGHSYGPLAGLYGAGGLARGRGTVSRAALSFALEMPVGPCYLVFQNSCPNLMAWAL